MSFVSKEIVAGDDLLAGATLMQGHLKIIAAVKTDRTGNVYDAVNNNGIRVHIKECFPDSYCKRIGTRVTLSSPRYSSDFRDAQKKLSHEARTLAKFDHKNIVGIHNIFEENGTTYGVFDRVSGTSLRQMIAKGRLTPEELSKIGEDLLHAVGYMHDQGILHGSITPDTVLITDELKPVLTEFATASDLVSKDTLSFSMPKVSDGFSPQEFYVAGGQTGRHSDLYMLAASLYFGLTGKTPPSAQTRLTAISRQTADPYVALESSQYAPSKDFAKALDLAMQSNPRQRMSDVEQWLKMIVPGRANAPVEHQPFAHSHSPKGTGIYRSPDH
ncbi:MAG: protein kinase [Litoreibacter sp.]